MPPGSVGQPQVSVTSRSHFQRLIRHDAGICGCGGREQGDSEAVYLKQDTFAEHVLTRHEQQSFRDTLRRLRMPERPFGGDFNHNRTLQPQGCYKTARARRVVNFAAARVRLFHDQIGIARLALLQSFGQYLLRRRLADRDPRAAHARPDDLRIPAHGAHQHFRRHALLLLRFRVRPDAKYQTGQQQTISH
jgi:hypothetical protein